MRKHRFFPVLLAILIVITSLALSVSAVSGQAYGEKKVVCKNWTNPVKDHAYSYITRNSTLPVENFLSVKMYIQYQEGNNFCWEDPLFDGNWNIDKASTELWRYSIMANKTEFVAESVGCDTYTGTITATP